MVKIVRDPAMKERLVKLGYDPVGSGSAELAAAQVVGFLLVLARVGPLFLLAPIFSAIVVKPRTSENRIETVWSLPVS